MYAIYAYIGVVLGVNGAAYMAVPWVVSGFFFSPMEPQGPSLNCIHAGLELHP